MEASASSVMNMMTTDRACTPSCKPKEAETNIEVPSRPPTNNEQSLRVFPANSNPRLHDRGKHQYSSSLDREFARSRNLAFKTPKRCIDSDIDFGAGAASLVCRRHDGQV